MSQTLQIELGGQVVDVQVSESIVDLTLAVARANEAADDAEAFAQVAGAVSGPLFVSISEGLANTTDGQEFLVDNFDGTGTVYLNLAGSEVLRRVIILAPSNGGAAALIGHRKSGSGTITRTVADSLEREPQDHGVTFDGTPEDAARIASFFASARPEIMRHGGRQFLGEGAVFNGVFGSFVDYTGLSDLTRALHNWAPRDSQMWIDSQWGAMTVVASSQASKAVNWPGSPTFTPASIGVSGFGINDVPNGQVWGVYADAIRMPGVNGFTVALETAFGNFSDESKTTPFTLTNGSARSGVGLWVQSGAGLDLVAGDLIQEGLTPLQVNHASAAMTVLSSFGQLGVPFWATGTAYTVGAKVEDPQSNTVWQCITPHTSPGSGTFADYRAANIGVWKAIPGHLSGIVFGATSLAELSPGGNIFSAIEMTERMQIGWYRKNGSGGVEQSATVYADFIPDGSPAVAMIFRQGQVFSNGVWSGNADGTNGARIQGRGAGQVLSFEWDGTNILFFVDGTQVKSL